MNTRYNNNVAGALGLITVNGSTYQLGMDATSTVGGIVKLYDDLSASNTDGAVSQSAIKAAIDSISQSASGDASAAMTAAQAAQTDVDALEALVGTGYGEDTTVKDYIDAKASDAKTVVAKAANETYLTLSSSTAADGHVTYTLGTTGIDSAISTAIAAIVDSAPAAFDTLKEIADWIQDDQTGAAAIVADVTALDASKADKVASATSGNFAGLDANGNLTDSGSKAADFKTVQTAKTSPAASGNALAFIDTISQSVQGVITATKKNITVASASSDGLMAKEQYSKVAAINASVSGNVLSIVTAAA